MSAIPELLFICTGNYYRSRFAEAIFNHRARESNLGWTAFSRGLEIHRAPNDAISLHTKEALELRSIALEHSGTEKVQLDAADLSRARRIVALQEEEHMPMVARDFPGWLEKVEFWDVPDMPFMEPEEALSRIERYVGELVHEIARTPTARWSWNNDPGFRCV